MSVFLRCRAFVFAVLAAFVPLSVCAADKTELERQRQQFPLVYETALKGPVDTWRRLATGLERYPLFPYLELASLQRKTATLKREDVDAFLKAWPDSLPASMLRETFLFELARRQDWKNFAALYDDATRNRELRCDAQQARLALGQKPDFAKDLQPLWLSDKPLPAACAAPMRWARDQGLLKPELIWQRIDL
ncbi:MAG TPA: lytic murein transglycosylase, partial [Rudaea sp.]